MPNRLLKEGIVDSSPINELSPEEEVFFYRLLVVSDDFGRMDARPQILKSRCFPLKDNIKADKIESWLRSLVRQELAICYQVDGKPYLEITKWEQRVRSKPKYPSADCGQLTDMCQTDDGLGKGLGKGKGKGLGKGDGGGAVAAATRLSADFLLPDEWILFCNKERPELDAVKIFDGFRDYWISKPKDNTKLDWFATWRTWVRRQKADMLTASERNQTVMSGLTRGLIGGGNNVRLLGK